jgi:hypothetical protein
VTLFDPRTYGPQPGDRIITVGHRKPGEVRRIVRWIGRHQWPAQIVLWLGAVTVCYLALVLGSLFGAGTGLSSTVDCVPICSHMPACGRPPTNCA